MSASGSLSSKEKAQVERNRQKALLLRQDRISKRHAQRRSAHDNKKIVNIEGEKLLDSGAGFFIAEADLKEQEAKKANITSAPAPLMYPDKPTCKECNVEFTDSFLFLKFDYAVCDKCRDNEEKHALITKTDAKNEFLLKDFDFDGREPPLKCIVRPNPHNQRWGDMKLFLRLQVEKRALEVWETQEKLEDEHEKREINREKLKKKKYDKNLKALRRQVRSSLYKMKEFSTHEHTFGEESYNEEEDEYSRTCVECGHSQVFEKM